MCFSLYFLVSSWCSYLMLLRQVTLILTLCSCYANVVLQCLTFTPPLTAYFLQGLHSKACIQCHFLSPYIIFYFILVALDLYGLKPFVSVFAY